MRSLIAAILLTAALGCGSSNPPSEPSDDEAQTKVVLSNGEVTLRPGQLASVDSGALSVVFVAVASDYRCPADVVCVWEGDAELTFRIENPMSEAPFAGIDTLRVNRDPRAVTRFGYRVEVKALQPYPYSSQPPGTRDYRVTLAISRATD